MPKSKVFISIDGEIYNGYRPAARVLATDAKTLFLNAHRHKGEFVTKTRKVKVLHFLKVCNYERYKKIVAQRVESKRRWRAKNHDRLLEHNREVNRAWCSKHRKERCEAQKRYIERKKLKEQEAQPNGDN